MQTTGQGRLEPGLWDLSYPLSPQGAGSSSVSAVVPTVHPRRSFLLCGWVETGKSWCVQGGAGLSGGRTAWRAGLKGPTPPGLGRGPWRQCPEAESARRDRGPSPDLQGLRLPSHHNTKSLYCSFFFIKSRASWWALGIGRAKPRHTRPRPVAESWGRTGGGEGCSKRIWFLLQGWGASWGAAGPGRGFSGSGFGCALTNPRPGRGGREERTPSSRWPWALGGSFPKLGGEDRGSFRKTAQGSAEVLPRPPPP